MKGSTGSADRRTDARTIYITRLALLTAIMIIMSFTPLGYLRTPLLSITLMSTPVAIGGILFGPLAGAYLGAVFGVTSLINAVTGGGLTGMLLLINPLAAIFTMLAPRILEGWISALIYCFFKNHKAKRAGIFAASLSCPVLNTVLFMGLLILFFFNSDYIQGLASSFGSADPLMFIIAFVGVQGLIEAVICFVISALISITLMHINKSL